ncbi:hypothetical protein G3I60_05480 [Streptomyces sp. SID13666]|uniref:hypothetical protein n=1 Tax=Streptomyces sp. SID13666 TaxID=2706054 RepID=UPI0013C0609C|nr:hypothetical protein [Streptomyces sp. SID13666]NEA53622.1 hypothetical protein [Streptomyces sp. SID13666]
MPKRPTAAQRAREVQQATGVNYTTALRGPHRRPLRPSEVLYAAVRAAGLAWAVSRLDDIFRAERARAPYLAEAERLDGLIYNNDGRLSRTERQAIQEQADIAWRLAGAYDDDPWDEAREVLWVAGTALARAGSLPDGRRLAEAAAEVLGQDDPEVLSDWVRCPGRLSQPGCSFVGCECEAMDTNLTGPDTTWAQEARAAVRALARAARVPYTGNDEQRTEAADLLEEALYHTRKAAGLPEPGAGDGSPRP